MGDNEVLEREASLYRAVAKDIGDLELVKVDTDIDVSSSQYQTNSVYSFVVGMGFNSEQLAKASQMKEPIQIKLYQLKGRDRIVTVPVELLKYSLEEMNKRGLKIQ